MSSYKRICDGPGHYSGLLSDSRSPARNHILAVALLSIGRSSCELAINPPQVRAIQPTIHHRCSRVQAKEKEDHRKHRKHTTKRTPEAVKRPPPKKAAHKKTLTRGP